MPLISVLKVRQNTFFILHLTFSLLSMTQNKYIAMVIAFRIKNTGQVILIVIIIKREELGGGHCYKPICFIFIVHVFPLLR